MVSDIAFQPWVEQPGDVTILGGLATFRPGFIMPVGHVDCPHSFTVVHWGPDNQELQRWVVANCANLSQLSGEHAEATASAPGSFVVLYDVAGAALIRLG